MVIQSMLMFLDIQDVNFQYKIPFYLIGILFIKIH